jgi:hypothetical protein
LGGRRLAVAPGPKTIFHAGSGGDVLPSPVGGGVLVCHVRLHPVWWSRPRSLRLLTHRRRDPVDRQIIAAIHALVLTGVSGPSRRAPQGPRGTAIAGPGTAAVCAETGSPE